MRVYHSWVRILPASVVKNLATLGPLGYVKKAPGSVATVAGLIWYTVVFMQLGYPGYFFTLILTGYLAVEICGEAEKRIFKRDPSEVVLDEFVAVPVCFIGLQYSMTPENTWIFMFSGFILFRAFDIFKPLGIKGIQNLPSGLGIVLDDGAAALATCLSLHLLVWVITG